MTSWADFEARAPELASAGRRRLLGDDGIAIGFLATAAPPDALHLSPVCPIFCDGQLYLSAGARTPKVRDLRSGGGYVLHGFLGEQDEEFQVSGSAAEVFDASEREAVHAAIPFPAFEPEDPIFRLSIERSLWVHWENVGRPETRAVRRRWSIHAEDRGESGC